MRAILDKLEQALTTAANLDLSQEHEAAANTLESAIADSNVEWDGQPGEIEFAIEFTSLIQRCSREAERQRLRQCRLNTYRSR